MTHPWMRRRWRQPGRLLAALLPVVLAAGAAAAVSLPAPAGAAPVAEPAGAAPVEPQVSQAVSGGEPTDFWVYLDDQADLTAAAGTPGRAAQGQAVLDELTGTATESQAGLRALLDAAGADYQPFWIANAVQVRGGDQELLERISELPEVVQVTADHTYEIPEPIPAQPEPAAGEVEWGIDRIRAPQVWDELGATGEGIVIGAVDAGALYTHEALVDAYRGNLGNGEFDHNYNWHDPSRVCGNPSREPCDNTGHGTHVLGTMVGADGIGVAPQAQWIVAKGCETSSNCSQAALLSAGQFMLAPTDLTGQNPRPDLRPHIVNNSWGGPASTDPWYRPVVEAWVAAGIFPQFAAGNTSLDPVCASAGNPGNLPASYAAGAFDIDGNIAAFSRRGPSVWGGDVLKPNLSAPGVAVRSAWNDGGYNSISGTSMASPHVAGTVALLWSAAVRLERDIEATRELLDQTAVDVEDLTCGGTAGNNNVWGQGRLDAYAAVGSAPREPVGTLTGTVTDAVTGDPIGDATVALTGELDRREVTRPDGTYAVRLPAGDYRVTASAYGYRRATADAVVTGDGSVTRDFRLAEADRVTLRGRVTDESGHGWPLYAEVTIIGTPVRTHTDPATGQYAVSVPADAAYRLMVDPVYPGYPTDTATVEVADQDVTRDLNLAVERCDTAPGYRYASEVAILGDYEGQLTGLLDRFGIHGTDVTWEDDLTGFDAVIVNRPGTPPEEVFQQFLADTDAAGVGVVFNDSYSNWGNGISLLNRYLGNPSTRSASAASASPYLYYQVVAEHPVLAGFEAGDEIMFDEASAWKHHAWFEGYQGEGRQVIATAGRGDLGVRGGGIGVQERDNNRHVLLSMHGVHSVADPQLWTDDGRQLLANALQWVDPDVQLGCAPVAGGLVLGQVTDRNTGDPVERATVSAGETTVTSAATPDDPDLADGFYWLFAPQAGEQELTTRKQFFQPVTDVVQVAGSAVTEVDVALPAGQLTVEPADLVASVPSGRTPERTFTVTNTGSAPAELGVSTAGGPAGPLSAGGPQPAAAPGGQVQYVEGDYSPAAPTTASAPAAEAASEPAAAGWTTLPNYPLTATDNSAAIVDGTLYSVGGANAFALAAGYAFDPATGQWRRIADLPTAVARPVAGGIDGKLYVAGGWPGGGTADAGFVYQPDQDRWSQVADLPAARAAAGSAVVDGRLYAVGGCADTSCTPTQTVWRYDPNADKWQTLADYPEPTAWLGCAGIGGQVYCTGGMDTETASSATYAYDPVTDAWTERASLPYDNWAMAAAETSGKLVVSSGVTNGFSSITNRGAAYDPGTDQWTEIEPTARASFRMGAACGFYTVAGRNSAQFPTSRVEQHTGLGGCGDSEAPWLAADPPASTLAPGESTTVTVAMDSAAAVDPGTHLARLRLRHDTPYALDPVPVTLRVREPVACDRTVTGLRLGHLVVADGVTCLADGASVIGRVTVRPGAGLVAGAATIIGPVTADRAALVDLSGTEVTGLIQVHGTTGAVNLDQARVIGLVGLVDNATGDWPIVLAGNRFRGPLECTGNHPAPVDEGAPNQVIGVSFGQCAGW
ncbi:MAG: S8 family serine peptidase [Micromonosporaceae bacterium]|nr:S8 family serine peptidase [Micromonosporaceae bacterium]